MNARLCIALAALAIVPGSSALAQTTDQPWGVELATGRQQLSNNSPDWTETSVRLGHGWGTRAVTELGAVRTERFGLQDEQYTALIVRPVHERLTATVEGSVSPTHRVLARHHAGASLQYEVAPAWLVHGGLRSTWYNNAAVTQGSAMLEHYVSAFSWLLAWRPVQTLGTSTASVEARGNYYYDERSAVGLSLSSGQEAVVISETDLRLADVQALALTGRHWLDTRWAINYEWSSTRYGDFYTRSGWRIGVQHRF